MKMNVVNQDVAYFLHRLTQLTIGQKTQTEREIYYFVNKDDISPFHLLNAIASQILKRRMYLTNNLNASWDHMFSCFTYELAGDLDTLSNEHSLIVKQYWMQGFHKSLGNMILEILSASQCHLKKTKIQQPVQNIHEMLR